MPPCDADKRNKEDKGVKDKGKIDKRVSTKGSGLHI